MNEPMFYPDWYERGIKTIDADENDTTPHIGNQAYYDYLTEVLTAADPETPIRWGRIQLAIVLDRMIRKDEARRA